MYMHNIDFCIVFDYGHGDLSCAVVTGIFTCNQCIDIPEYQTCQKSVGTL